MFLERALERISLLFPRKRIFFIYTHRNGKNRFGAGLKANTEISYFSFCALQKKFRNVVFLRLEGEKPFRIRAIGQRDIVIGHIGETYVKASERTKQLIAFYPWSGHLDRSKSEEGFNCLSREKEAYFLEKAASLIFLTSEYNKAKYIECQENFLV